MVKKLTFIGFRERSPQLSPWISYRFCMNQSWRLPLSRWNICLLL